MQAEYILEEKVPGVRLGAVWHSLPWGAKLAIVNQVADFDATLSAASFKTHGCIYFKKDLQRLTGYAAAIQVRLDQKETTLEQYAIGPSTKAELWISGREQLDVDRGPCASIAQCYVLRHMLTRARARTASVHERIRRQRDIMD